MKGKAGTAASGASVKLAGGHDMPMLGIGTWMLSGKACTDAVGTALRIGYRHIDTADYYRNHRDVAAAMKGYDRESIFLTTKVWFTDLSADGIDNACRRFLKEFDTDYIDLLLAHWPNDKVPIAQTMGAMENLAREGLVRSVGVSNFDERRLSAAISASNIPISSNQVEFHAHLYQKDLLSFCDSKGIAVTAYCPLGRGAMAKDSILAEIAARLGRTPSQVALRWLLQHGITVIPKSTSEAHMKENMDIFSWKLQKADMQAIDALGATDRLVNPAFTGSPFFDSVGAKIARIMPGGMINGKRGKGFFDKDKK